MEAEDPGKRIDVPRQVGEDKWSGRGRGPPACARMWFTLNAEYPLFAVAHSSFDHPGVAIFVAGDPGHGRHCSLVVQPELQRRLVVGLRSEPVDLPPLSSPLRAVPATSCSRSISSHAPRLYRARTSVLIPLNSEPSDLVLLGKGGVAPLPVFFFRAGLVNKHTWSIKIMLEVLFRF